MAEIFDGQWVARLDDADEDGVVLFLIGMRVNKWWRVDLLCWIGFAMGRMLRYLGEHPEVGLIRARNWFGRTTMQVGYWRSLEQLVAFASDRDAPHAPAWQRFYRKVNESRAIGIWHETYLVKPGGFEAVYGNMPRFGLAEAVEHVPVDRTTSSATKRVRRAAHSHA